MKRAGTGLPPTKVARRTGCYSDNRTWLACEYGNPGQPDAYRTHVLHPKLIELACSDASIAAGIAKRGFDESADNDPDFGLAAALLKVLDAPEPCAGLTALSEQLRQKLRNTAELQKITATPK